MSRRQLDCVLARNHVARIAFYNGFRVELRPVHYVYSNGMLFGRSSFDMKAVAWLIHPEVVLEVDEVDGVFDWRSVLVRGIVSVLQRGGTAAQHAEYWSAVEALRTFIPATLTERDPTPERNALFRIEPAELTGREARGR
ncbi:MAG: pyridoxamine 5'-phosphate oxidase family protein [Gemmatimonadaceae bacterium]